MPVEVLRPNPIEQVDMREPEVAEDVRLAAQRRRVSLILRSAAFRSQLERITAIQTRTGHPQEQPSLFSPHSRFGCSPFARCITLPILPIDDLRGQSMLKSERITRCKLASVYRIMELFGWSNSSNFCHITSRVGQQDQDEYLIEPTGILFNEVTASSLIKVDLAGKILDPGSLNLPLDLPGWLLHAAIYQARKEIRSVVHLSTPAAIVISSLSDGLLPLSQEAMIVGPVAVYEFDPQSGRSQAEESRMISEALNAQPADCRAIIVRNLGIFVFGFTIEEAWMNSYTANLACEAQLRLIACIDTNELVLPSNEAQRRAMVAGRNPSHVQMGSQSQFTWRMGELEFEAMMRRLDAAGYRTGYIYRMGQTLKHQQPETVKRQEAVTVPPSSVAKSTADATLIQEEKRLRRHWTSTPNAYKKSVIKEFGTATPSDIAKWTGDELDDTPVRRARRPRAMTLPRAWVDEYPLTPAASKAHTLTAGVYNFTEDPNAYAPQGKNPRELKSTQNKIRQRYYKGVRTAGPRSRLLMGLDDDDAAYTHSDGDFSGPTSPGGTLLRLDPRNPVPPAPGHVILVGAVSKGIIKPKVRHNVALYQSVYQPNPFVNVTNEELDKYMVDMGGRPGKPAEPAEESPVEKKPQVAEMMRRPKSELRSETDATAEDTDADDGKQKKKKKRRFKFSLFSSGSKSDKEKKH